MSRSTNKKFWMKYIAILALAAVSVGVSVAYAEATPESYCEGQGGYIADNVCYIGTPANCGPASPVKMCVDPIPQAGVLIKTCSCGS